MTTLPGVNIITNIVSSLLTESNTGSALLIGTSTWGRENELLTFEGSSDINSEFKSGAIPINANLFVAGGGREFYLYRFVPDDAVASTKILQNSTTDVITLTGKYKGSYGNNLTVTVETINTDKKKITISNGSVNEVYDNDGAGYDDNDDIVLAINTNSSFVLAEKETEDLPDDLAKSVFSGGDDGSAITQADVEAVINTTYDKFYGFLLVPEITTDASQGVFATMMDNRETNDKKQTFYVTGITKDEAYATTITRTASSNNGLFIRIAPGTVEYNDTTYSGAYAASYYAGLLSKISVGESLTHKTFALPMYVNYTSNLENYKDFELKQLKTLGITAINQVGNYQGVVQAVTSITDITNPFFEQVVRRETNYIKENLYVLLNPFVGQQNTIVKRAQIKGVVDGFMIGSINDAIIEDYEVEVILGESSDKVDVNLSFDPIYPINTIDVTLTI